MEGQSFYVPRDGRDLPIPPAALEMFRAVRHDLGVTGEVARLKRRHNLTAPSAMRRAVALKHGNRTVERRLGNRKLFGACDQHFAHQRGGIDQNDRFPAYGKPGDVPGGVAQALHVVQRRAEISSARPDDPVPVNLRQGGPGRHNEDFRFTAHLGVGTVPRDRLSLRTERIIPIAVQNSCQSSMSAPVWDNKPTYLFRRLRKRYSFVKAGNPRENGEQTGSMGKPVGIALIGTGYIGQRTHLPAYQKMQEEGLIRLVALCDVHEESVKTAAQKFGVRYTFSDHAQMLEMDEIDAVDVCTPNYLHKQPVIDSFAAGKHVICEKPLAINACEGAAMVAAGQAAGKKFQVAFNLRFGSGPQAVKRFIHDGKLGEIYYARAHALRRRGIPGWGSFTQKDKQGGGPLIDIGAHILDLTLWLMGCPEPVSVTGQTYVKFGMRADVLGLRGQWDPKTYSVEDFAAGFVRFANGATLSLESSFAANLAEDQFQAHLFGTEGGAFLEPANDAATRLFREESGTLTDTTLVFLPKIQTVDAELRAFVQAISDDTPVPVPAEEALRVTRILDALYLSAETGREVLMTVPGRQARE